MNTHKAIIESLQGGPLKLADLCNAATQRNPSDRLTVAKAMADLIVEGRVTVDPTARTYLLVPQANTKNASDTPLWIKIVDTLLLVALFGGVAWADYGNTMPAEPPFISQGE